MTEPDWQKQIQELQTEGRKAFLAGDVARLRGMWADDLVVNSPINRIHTKDQVLDLLEKGIIRHSSMTEHVEVVRRQGDVVIVMGHDVVTDPPHEVPVQRRFTNVWRSAGGSWQLIARHAQVIGQA